MHWIRSRVAIVSLPLESASADCAAMAYPQVVSTLRRKRDEIESAIVTYRAKIQDAERHLCAVTATLRLFELSGEAQKFCKSAQGPNADRRRKYLNILALAGSFPALVHTDVESTTFVHPVPLWAI
jgi:hypothetical protein